MTKEEIEQLESRGCFSADWSLVEIEPGTDLGAIRNVWFRGPVSIGTGTRIINVPGGISNVRIGRNVVIENVARIENSPCSKFGIGTDVAVLDETGSRRVRIYPGISAQVAALAAGNPRFAREKLDAMIDAHTAAMDFDFEIGDGARLCDCGPIVDVRIWPGAVVEGVEMLRNGSIVSNASGTDAMARAGHGVNAENFIIEDAAVDNGSLIRNAYVGQGSVLDKGFSAHDSLFFANCSMENGEACALFAGPYTVSMHKSSLLIGCQTSFFNAGSGTNMSNHMYKLGPIHWGVLERGVKTASNAYIMHEARIGAHSLVMGDIKGHPDSSAFPFSYLIADGRGGAALVPGAMLRSYGLKRDSAKWPARDRRPARLARLNDRITFDILNPISVEAMADAIPLLEKIESEASVGPYGSISPRSAAKGKDLYRNAIFKYLHDRLGDTPMPIAGNHGSPACNWVDLGGQIITVSRLRQAMSMPEIEEMERCFDEARTQYETDEKAWIAEKLGQFPRAADAWRKAAESLEALVEADRLKSITSLGCQLEKTKLMPE